LNLGPHRRAYAAVVTGGPAAVLDLAPGQGVLPVPPQPLAVETGVEVVPRQDLVLVAFPRGVPVEVDGLVGERLGGALGPAVEREVLAPAVEPAARLPHGADHLADAAVTTGQQALDDRRLAVVVAVPDRPAVLLVGAQRVAQHAQPPVDGLVVALRGPLERRVRLGHERADRHRAPDVPG